MILNSKYCNRLNPEFLFCLITWLFICSVAHSQSYNFSITNYPPSSYESDEFATSPDNYDMVQDDNGLIYVANGSGLLVFDGVKWTMMDGTEHMQKGVLGQDEKGTIYVAQNQRIGFLKDNERGKKYFQQIEIALPKSSASLDIRKIISYNEATYFISPHSIYQWDGASLDSLRIKPDTFDASDAFSRALFGNTKLSGTGNWVDAFIFKNTLFFYNNGLVPTSLFTTAISNNVKGYYALINHQLVKSALLNDDSLSNIRVIIPSGKTLKTDFYFFSPGAIGRYYSEKVTKQKLTDTLLIEGINRNSGVMLQSVSFVLPNNDLIIGTYRSGIFILDSMGRVKEKINQENGLLDNTILNLYIDNQGAIWALMLHGLSRIKYPISMKIFDQSIGIQGVSNKILVDSEKLLVATSEGVFVHNLLNPDANLSWNNSLLLKANSLDIKKENYEFQIASEVGFERITVGEYDGHGYSFAWTLNDRPAYSVGKFYHGPDTILCIGRTNEIEFRKHKLKRHTYKNTVREEYILDSIATIGKLIDTIKTIAVSKDEKVWFAHYKVGYIDFSKEISSESPVTFFDSSQGVEMNHRLTYKVHCINENVYLTSSRGIYKFNPQQNRFEPDCSFGNIFCDGKNSVNDIAIDSTGNYWVASENTVGRVMNQNGEMRWDTIAFSIILSHAHVNSIYIDYRNQVWAATDKGVYAYDQNIAFDFKQPFKTLIREFNINSDSTVNFGYASDVSKVLGGIAIPFGMRGISVDFAGTDYTNPKKLLYSYQLEGRDDTWSAWSKETTRNFDGLFEGEYIFRVKAKNLYGTESSIASYKFTILPPWYRTWWAYLLYLLIAIIIVYLIVRLNQGRLIAEKKNLEKKVGDRTRELKDAQSQLVQSEKMASLGQLTAGVAHEINNPINFVSANITPLKRDIDEIMHLLEVYSSIDQSNYTTKLNEILKYRDQIDLNFTMNEIKSLIRGIEEGSNRTAAIVKGLRNFSRLDEEEMKKTNIHEGIDSTLLLLNNKLSANRIEVVKSFGNIPEIKCYPGQLNQVFMNVITNAIDAIGTEGKIFITTSYVRHAELGSASAKPGEIPKQVRDDNGSVVITIRDTGKGMSDEVKQKIFDPFFTTKDVGKGTGLGLSISFGIIEKHNGKITVNSKVGEGTEVIISLPA